MAALKQIVEMSKDDLTEVISGIMSEKAEAKAYDKYYNVLVPISWVSAIHKVNPTTIRRYIERGLIVPEERESREDRLITRREAAKALNITLQTLWCLEKRGELIPNRVGKKVLYRETALTQYLNRNHFKKLLI